jgi:hypothetical protein
MENSSPRCTDSVLRIYRKRHALKELPIELSIRPPVAAVTLRNRTLGPTVQLFLQCARELGARNSYSASPAARIDRVRRRLLLMLWTAPPHHESAIEVPAVRTSHDSEETEHAHDYDRRSRYREGNFSDS